jgi:hypothetical protein
MKQVLIAVFLTVASGAQAQELAPMQANRFWNDVRALVVQCAVRPYTVENGEKVFDDLRSKCAELQVQDSNAIFSLSRDFNGERFVAVLEESPYSDGGDLDNLIIKDATGEVIARRENVPAFGDILVALAGGEVQSSELYVPSIAASY